MAYTISPQGKPLFITFEGLDRCGKTTQINLLGNVLRGMGQRIICTKEPGGTALGRKIRQMLLDVDEVIDPLAEVLLYSADRAQHVRTVIKPALMSGSIVISD